MRTTISQYDDTVDVAAFDEALARHDAGELGNAIRLLERLAARQPNRPAFVGMLASVQYENGDYKNSAANARRAISLSPRCQMASVTLFQSLYHLGDHDGAFREIARFRAIRHSAEYERTLPTIEAKVLRKLQSRPLDSEQRHLLEIVRAELEERPLKH